MYCLYKLLFFGKHFECELVSKATAIKLIKFILSVVFIHLNYCFRSYSSEIKV